MSPAPATVVPVSKRDQNRIEQRARILKSARMLFSSQGFEEVTVADIARHAGVARATVFNYFASKHALIDAITEDVLAVYSAMLDQALADDRSPTPALLRALFDQMGEGIEQLQRFYKGVFREIAKMQVGLEEGGASANAREVALRRLAALLARGQARGEISAEFAAQDLALAFDSLTHGTIVQWLYDDPSKSLRERMGRAVEIYLGSVATGPGAVRQEPLPDLSDAEPA